ncbi:MAG: hypothetical protein MJZ67_03370 [Bacteroidales bacterium]|nr:hypothetical protein [Bacteroidales bacterium]
MFKNKHNPLEELILGAKPRCGQPQHYEQVGAFFSPQKVANCQKIRIFAKYILKSDL